MKKTLLPLVAALLCLSLLSACVPATGADTAGASAPEPAAPQTASPAPDAPAAAPAPTDAGMATVEANLEAMLPVLNSVALAIDSCGNYTYDPDNSEFFWYVLHLAGLYWSDAQPEIIREGDRIVVPASAMAELAAAAFPGSEVFLPLPEGDEKAVTYDPERERYLLAPYIGSTEARLDGFSVWADGGIFADVSLVWEGTLMGTVEFVLADAPDRGAAYPYTVQGAELAMSYG